MDILALFRNSKNAVRLSAGEVLFHEGDAADAMYAVTEGELAIETGGREIDTLLPGDLLGEMAIVDDSPRSATATAKRDTEVVPIDREWFLTIVSREPRFALHLLEVAAGRVRRLMHQD